MKDRLKKKLKAKKILGNNGQFSVYKQKPAKKKVYPMPPEYNEHLEKLTELLDSREEYNKMLPTLPLETRREALPLIRKLDESIEDFEQRMADEYEDFQKREAHIEQLEEDKEESKARLYDHLQRGFILMKHKLPAETFESFEKKWTGKMGKAEREEFYELIAHRESYDLEHILAHPNGYIIRPMKHPQIQMNEAMFEIDRVVYVTNDDFKQLEAEYEKALAICDKVEKNLWLYNPEHRPEKVKQIEELDRQLAIIKPKLMEFLQTCFAEDGKVEVENPDQKKLDAAFAQADVASDRLHLMYKHALPHLYQKFRETSFRDMTPKEIKEAEKRIAKREAEELDEILASLK